MFESEQVLLYRDIGVRSSKVYHQLEILDNKETELTLLSALRRDWGSRHSILHFHLARLWGIVCGCRGRRSRVGMALMINIDIYQSSFIACLQ
jgi:hypothetical protein